MMHRHSRSSARPGQAGATVMSHRAGLPRGGGARPWRRFGVLVAVGAAVLISAGCEESETGGTVPTPPVGTYSYIAYDESGVAAVTGRLNLVADAEGRLGGSWRLDFVPPPRSVGPQVGEGLLRGVMHGDTAFVDLNPDWVDNNVILTGQLTHYAFEGEWSWTTFAGPRTGGSFTARRERWTP